MTRPIIVTLCGSARFTDAYREAMLQETLAGKIVLSIGCDMLSDHDHFARLSDEQRNRTKAMLDELHLRKIEMSDEVLILDVRTLVCAGCGKPCQGTEWCNSACCAEPCDERPYIGSSTRNELNHALALGKRVRYLSRDSTTPARVGDALL